MSAKDNTFQERLSNFVKDEVNPNLASHGGWIEIVSTNEDTGVIELKMGGGCQGCGASAATLQYGIKMALMDEFKEINEVLDATDHSAGENPFYMGNPFK
jgi:Fe-S cluster biogenesis protein NfuA